MLGAKELAVQWVVTLIYGIIIAFLVLGALAFLVQGVFGGTLGGGTILFLLLVSLVVVWFMYPAYR
jgi:hypothetical protein